MKIGQLRTLIEGRSDNEEIFIAIYDRDEVNEFIVNNIEEDETEVTDDEWNYIYASMNTDDGIWSELNDSFRYYIDNVIEKRRKGEENVSSK